MHVVQLSSSSSWHQYLGVLDEVPPRHGSSHGLQGGEVVVHAVFLSLAAAPRGVAAPEPKLRHIGVTA